jgi:hypothetical protein
MDQPKQTGPLEPQRLRLIVVLPLENRILPQPGLSAIAGRLNLTARAAPSNPREGSRRSAVELMS